MKRTVFNEKMRLVELLIADYRKATVTEINQKWPERLDVISRVLIDLAYEIVESHEN